MLPNLISKFEWKLAVNEDLNVNESGESKKLMGITLITQIVEYGVSNVMMYKVWLMHQCECDWWDLITFLILTDTGHYYGFH